MFNEVKAIERRYEEKMGFSHDTNPYGESITGLIIKALFAIAREVDSLKKEVYTKHVSDR